MTVRKIVIWPDDILEDEAAEVSSEEDISNLIDDMIDTMIALQGAGIAAPQVGVSKQIFVIDKETDESLDDHLIMINPKINDGFGDTVSIEGCLSFPGFEFHVPRAEILNVTFQDRNGEIQELNASGFLSIAIQHEMDHLTGDLLDRTVNRQQRRGMRKTLSKFKKRLEAKNERRHAS